MVSIATWTFYAFIDQTATLYNGLSAYASGTVSLAKTKQLIKSGIINYILIVVAAAASYSFTAGGGRLLASLYTRRQMNYVSHFLLNANNLLYHSRHMLDIPNILSHDIAELNTEVFNILFGHIYYVGIISRIVNYPRIHWIYHLYRSIFIEYYSFHCSKQTKRWIYWEFDCLYRRIRFLLYHNVYLCYFEKMARKR